MRIYADPTELRETSRIDDSLRAAVHELPGLEARTGADFLLTILDLPLPENNDEMLKLHCQDGLLIQTKRFGDLQSSIIENRLFHSLQKMLDYTPRAWLIVIGALVSVDGKSVIGEVRECVELHADYVKINVVGRKGLNFNAVDGAMDAWRDSGGYAKCLSRQADVFSWCRRRARFLEAAQTGEVKQLKPRSVQRALKAPGSAAYISALFEGIGIATATLCFEQLAKVFVEHGLNGEPQIIDAIAYLTDYTATEISGISESMVAGWRRHLGLADHPSTYAQLAITWKDRETDHSFIKSIRHQKLIDIDI